MHHALLVPTFVVLVLHKYLLVGDKQHAIRRAITRPVDWHQWRIHWLTTQKVKGVHQSSGKIRCQHQDQVIDWYSLYFLQTTYNF